jgi:hypothetical protein
MGRAFKAGWVAGVAAALFVSASANAALIYIDQFVDPQTAFVSSGGSNPKSSAPNEIAAPGALGGARFLNATRTSGSGVVYADVSGGLLSHGAGPADSGISTATYDGTNDGVFNPTGSLGDLTAGGLNNGLKFQYRADLAGGAVSVTLYSGAGNFSTAQFVAGATGFDPNPYASADILFSSMVVGGGTGANPANVTGVKIVVDGSAVPALDLELLNVVSDVVPEPASLGLALVGASLLARRRK